MSEANPLYDDRGEEGGSKEGNGRGCCMCLFIFSLISVFFFFVTAVFCGILWVEGSYLNYCGGGAMLEPNMQRWCSVESKVDVTIHVEKGVNLYRIKKSELPNKTYSLVSETSCSNVSGNSKMYKAYTFMPGTSVKAVMNSSYAGEGCYLFDYFGYQLFSSPIALKYAEKGAGSLNFTYDVTEGSTYYFLFDHRSSDISKDCYDINVNYSLYEVDLINTTNCSETCTLKDVTPDEMIILKNSVYQPKKAQIILPSIANLWWYGITVIAPVFFLIITIVLFILTCVARKKIAKSEEEAPLFINGEKVTK